MTETDAIDFQCPKCKMKLRVPRERVPAAGLRGKCPKCEAEILVSPDGTGGKPAPETPQASPTTPPPPAGSSSQAPTGSPDAEKSQVRGFYVRRPDDSVDFLEDRALFRALRRGSITSWDLLSSDQVDYHAAMDWEELSPHLRGEASVMASSCYQHSTRLSAGSCERCGRGFCTQCLPGVESPAVRVRTCPACEGILKEPDPRWSEKPFWHRLDEVFLYPISNMAWVTTLGIAFLLWIGSRGLRGIPIYLMGLAYLVHVIQRSAKGDKTLGFGPDSSDVWYLAGSGLAALIVSAVVVLPIVLFNIFVIYKAFQEPTFLLLALLNLPLVLIAIVYYPMALGMTAVWRNRWLSLNPKVVTEAIMTIPGDYAMVVVAFIAMTIVDWSLAMVTGTIPFLGAILTSCVAAYLGIVQAHILGWTLYMNARNLGWE